MAGVNNLNKYAMCNFFLPWFYFTRSLFSIIFFIFFLYLPVPTPGSPLFFYFFMYLPRTYHWFSIVFYFLLYLPVPTPGSPLRAPSFPVIFLFFSVHTLYLPVPSFVPSPFLHLLFHFLCQPRTGRHD